MIREIQKTIANLHLARRMDVDRRRLRRTTDRDRDVERQVVRVGIRGRGAALNTANSACEQADQLNLTVERDNARERVLGGLDGLAHVTKNDRARSGGLSNEGVQGRDVGGHVARRVVADNVISSWDELERNGRTVGNNIGGVVKHGRRLVLADETGNGRHLIFRT